MFDKLVAGLLTSYLGEHFENIDTEQVKVSVWAGNVNLKRLTVRKDALRFFDVPFFIEQGFIEELVVVIPWSRLQSESVVFKMKGVRVVVRQKTYENYPLVQRRKDADARRARDLESSEDVLLDEYFREEREKAAAATQQAGATSSSASAAPLQSEEDRINNTFSARLRANILNNIKIEMEDLQIRYETTALTTKSAAPSPARDDADGKPKANAAPKPQPAREDAIAGITFRLASLETFPCNSAYQKTFIATVDGGKVRMMHKMVLIKGVQVVLSEKGQPERPLTGSLNAGLRVQYQPIPLDKHVPTWLVGAQLDALSASVSQDDVRLLYTLVQDVFTGSDDDWERLKLRPLQTVHHNPRAWMKYAIAAVRLALRKNQKSPSFSWEAYKEFKVQRDTYARLYRRARRTALGAEQWLTPLNAKEEVDYLNLEDKLPIETIKLGRRLALARVSLERQEYDTLKQQQAQQRQAKGSQGSGSGGGSGGAVPAAQTSATTTSTSSTTSGTATDAPVPAPAPSDGGSGWLKRWWSGAPNPSVERAIEKESSPEVRAVMQETVELMSTTKWTEAQRLAIAKEFGLSAQEANAMSEMGSPTSGQPGTTTAASPTGAHGDSGGGNGAATADASTVRCVFKGVLCFTSATVALKRRPDGTAADEAFAMVHLQGLTVGSAAWDNGRLESVFCVDELGIRSASRPLIYLCTDDSSAATPRTAPTMAQQKEHGERTVARVLQDKDAALVAVVQARAAPVTNTPGLFLWGTREAPATLKRNEAPHHVHVDLQPIGVNVDVTFLYETVHFFLAAYKRTHQPDQEELAEATAMSRRWCVDANESRLLEEGAKEGEKKDLTTPSGITTDAPTRAAEDAYIRQELGIAPITLLPIEARNLADHKSSVASLARKVETAWVVDWSISLGSLTLLVMEVDGEQGSRIHVRDFQAQNDVQRQLNRAARLAATTAPATSPAVSPQGAESGGCGGAGVGAFPTVTATPFGSEEADWVNRITASVTEWTLSCLFAPHGPGSAGVPQWRHVVEPIGFEYELKLNMLPRRNATYPGVSAILNSNAPLHLTLSRSRLSVVCTSLSFLIDFVQRTIREVMMTHTAVAASTQQHAAQANARHVAAAGVGSASPGTAAAAAGMLDWGDKLLFRARVLSVSKRYWTSTANNSNNAEDQEQEEEDESITAETTESYLRSFHPAPLQPLEYRYLHVQRGGLVIFHAMRPSYPHYCVELIKDHYKVSISQQEALPPSASSSHSASTVASSIVDIVVEQGGCDQESACDVAAARHGQAYLTDLFHVPASIFKNVTLLRPFIEDCVTQAGTTSTTTLTTAVDVDKVEAALQAVEAAAHAVPCQHVRLRLDDAAEATRLVQALQAAGLSRGLFTPSLEDYAALRDAVPEPIREQSVVQVGINTPSCVIDLCEEEEEEEQDDAETEHVTVGQTKPADTATRPPRRGQLTFAPFVVSAAQGIQWNRFALDTNDISLSSESSGRSLFALKRQNASVSAATPTPPVQIDCTLHAVPGNGLWPTRKVSHLHVLPGHVLAVDVRSELLQWVELLWDLVGIATNRVFSPIVVPAIPWWPAATVSGSSTSSSGGDKADVQAIEDAWVAAASCPERQQQLVCADLAAVACDFYLPDTLNEWAPSLRERAEKNHATPLLTFRATEVKLEWRLDAANNSTHCTLKSPVVQGRVLAALQEQQQQTSDGLTAVVGLGDQLQTLCAPLTTNTTASTGSCTVDFNIPTVVPVVSLSDFLRTRSLVGEAPSTAATAPTQPSPSGYRFTTAFALSAQGLRVLYFQPQLMLLLDIGTRGVMERAMAVTNRPAYLFGSSSRALASAVLPAWTEQWTTMPPTAFNWTLMHKKITLEKCIAWAPRSAVSASSANLCSTAPDSANGVFVLEMPMLEMHDRLQPVFRAAAAAEGTTKESVMSVGVTTRIRFVQAAVKSAASTICASMSLQVLLTLPLFDAAKFVAGKHRDCQMRFAAMTWRATGQDFADIVQGIFYEYMDKPAAPAFAPKPFPIIDPYVEASLSATSQVQLKETSRTVVMLPQTNWHSFDAAEWTDAPRAAPRVRDPISSVVVLRDMSVTMDSGLDGDFRCDVGLGEVALWDLAHMGAAGARFQSDPAEVCDASRAFLRLLHIPTRVMAGADSAASQAVRLSFHTQPGLSEVDLGLGVLQLSIVPRFFFDARDGFFSLAMRNAIGLVLHWPPLPATSSPPPQQHQEPAGVVVRRRWHASLGQLRLSLPDVLHNTLNPFVLFSVAGIDVLDETDAAGQLKTQHLIIAQLTRNGMYLYPDELATSQNGTALSQPNNKASNNNSGTGAAPKLRVFVMPPVSMAQLRAHQDPPTSTASKNQTYRDPSSSTHTGGAALHSPNTDLMDALFGEPAATSSNTNQQHQQQQSTPTTAPCKDTTAESTTATGPLFSCVNTPSEGGDGLVVRLSAVWIVVPHRHHVMALSSLWSQGGLSALSGLGTFLEARRTAAAPSVSTASATVAKPPSLFPRIKITIESPALVLPDRETNPGSATELQRGMLLSVGTILFEKSKKLAVSSPTSPPLRAGREEHYQRLWRLRVPDISICAISRPDEALLKPFTLSLERWDDEPTAWGWRLHVERVSLQMEQRYYEMLLQTIVRNMLTAAAARGGTRAQPEADHTLDFERTLRWFSLGPQTGHVPLTSAPASGPNSTSTAAPPQPAATTSGGTTGGFLYAAAEDELGLRHPFPAYDASEDAQSSSSSSASPSPSAAADHPVRVFQIQLRFDGVELCVFDSDTAAYMRVDDVDVVSNAEWHLLPVTHDTGTAQLPFRAPQRFLLQGRTRLVDRRRQMTARVGQVELGLRRCRPVLALVSSPVRHSIEDASSVDVSAAAYFAIDQKNLEETVEGHLGDGTLRLDSSVVATAVDVLYRPYARIVLPSYEVGEVSVLTRDRMLTAPLYLSQRATLRASGELLNHIVLNGGGNEIHFMDEAAQGSAGAVVFVDEGVTLRIINAILCFHGNSLDYYVKAGNGGYVVVDRQSCTTVTAEEANVTVAEVREALVNATVDAGGNVMDALFGEGPAVGGGTTNSTTTMTTVSGASPAAPAAQLAKPRRMRRYVVASSLRAEVPEPTYAHRVTPGDAPNRTLSRTLVLTATVHCCVVDIQQGVAANAHGESDSCTGTFDLSHFAVHSESCFRANASMAGASSSPGVTERTDLLSEWAVQVLYTKSVTGSSPPAQTHVYDVVAKSGVDVHIRYRDIFLCTAALQQANHALGLALGDVKSGAFSDVMGKLNAKSDQGRDVLRSRANAVRTTTSDASATPPSSAASLLTTTTTRINLEIAYCDLFLVNDQCAVDLPLFHLRVDNIRTPSCALTTVKNNWTLQLVVSIEFFDLGASSWYPCMEAVEMELKSVQVANQSIDELMNRNGFDSLEVAVKPVRLYFSPLLLSAVRRAVEVREAFQREQAQLELYGPALSSLSTTRQHSAAAAEAASASSAAVHPLTQAQQFHSVCVRQELGVKTVQVTLPLPRATGYEIESRAECAFDYPRVAGKEAERGQQYILLSVPPHNLVQRVYTYADGVAQVPLGPARLARHAVVDVSATHGRKEVVLRSNVSFVNNLSFQLLLEGGVGCVQPRGRTPLHVPVELLRQRVRFLPNVAFKSDDCGLGIRYENLPALRNKTFLCMCPVETGEGGAAAGKAPQMLVRTDEYELRRSVQRHLYFLLRVRDAPQREAARIEDVVGHMEAPLYVVNHIGLPIELQLMTQRITPGKKVGLLDLSPDFFVYDLVATVTVEPALLSHERQYRQDITQLDPFQDIAMDVVVQLPNGAVLGRRMESRVSAAGPRPACVYSPQNPNRRDQSMTLVDPKTGSNLVLGVSYEGNEVHLFCPYWLLNDTSYALQFTDVNPEKESRIPLIAGLQPSTPCDSVTPIGSQRSPFLYSSERSVKLKEKAHLYLRVGVSSQGTQSWTQWSASVNIFAPVECGVVSCVAARGVVLTLSYSVEVGEGRMSDTHLITVRPRWVLVNRTPRALSLRFATPSFGAVSTTATATSSETTVATAACHVFYRAPATAAAAAATAAPTSGSAASNSNNNNNNGGGAYMQMCFSADTSTGAVETCEWSAPFCISDEGEHAYNVRHRGLVRLEDYWPLSRNNTPTSSFAGSMTALTNQMPASLPPIQPEDVVERDKQLYLRRGDTTVVSVSCVRRASTTFVMITDATDPPFVIENRTDFMVWVRQERLDAAVAVYPKRTKAYTWDSEAAPQQMVLWLTNGTLTAHSASVTINFEARALLQGRGSGFQQEVEMPDPGGMPRMIFVRVRGVHGVSYAVSITTEPTIDVYCAMPYRQFFYRLHIDALYAVLEDAQHDDNMLLTIRPVHIEYAQGAGNRNARHTSASGAGVRNASLTASGDAFAGDVQRIDVDLQTVQLDDERAHAKQKVIAQIVDDNRTFCKYERYMLRSTPILYVPRCALVACPIEFHIEDSFLYDVMQYADAMRLAWQGDGDSSDVVTGATTANGAAVAGGAAGGSKASSRRAKETVLSGTSAAQGWMEEVATLSELTPIVSKSATSNGTVVQRRAPSWQQRVIFFGRLVIEKLLVSISLYRSPGAQNDPIWQRVGALSLLLRSVKDARLEWSRIDQRQVTEVVWVLLTRYSAFYRRRFREQIPSLVNIVGIGDVKNFFTKLVDDPSEDRDAVRRQKPRVSRRGEAHLLKDSPAYKERQRTRTQLVVKVEQLPPGVKTAPEPFSAIRLVERLRQRSSELSGPRERSILDLPFAHMLRQLTTREDLLLFGAAAIRQAVIASAPTFDISGNQRDAATPRSAESVIATHDRAKRDAAGCSTCTRCGEVEALEMQYAAADMSNPLPHPDEGIITWSEFVHHVTWDAFVRMCTVAEIQQYGPLVKDGIVGRTNNVVRLTI